MMDIPLKNSRNKVNTRLHTYIFRISLPNRVLGHLYEENGRMTKLMRTEDGGYGIN